MAELLSVGSCPLGDFLAAGGGRSLGGSSGVNTPTGALTPTPTHTSIPKAKVNGWGDNWGEGKEAEKGGKDAGWEEDWGDDWDEPKKPAPCSPQTSTSLLPPPTSQASASTSSLSSVASFTPDTVQGKRLHDWFKSGRAALSPTADWLAVADGKRLAIHRAVGGGRFVCQRIVEDCEGRETITQVICVPVMKQPLRSPQVDVCIIAGYSTGNIRAYTENGDLLISQRLHPEPVLQLRLSTPMGGVEGGAGSELVIVCAGAVVSVDGLSLYVALSACLSQTARGRTLDGGGLFGGEDEIAPPSLAYRKYALGEQKETHDVASTGLTCPTAYDHLVARTKGPPTVTQRYVSVGRSPFIGSFTTEQEAPHFSAVALASSMASSVATAVFSVAKRWWSAPAEEQPAKGPGEEHYEAATAIGLRSCIADAGRTGQAIAVDPTGKYGAVSDGYGRVLLVDLANLLVLRIWKGYRNAQCGWVKAVEETTDGQKGRTTYFLAILAPKRGLLEIWCLWPSANRIDAFDVGLNCRLLYPGHSQLGPQSPQTMHNSNAPIGDSGCFLFREGGSVLAISVPFHFALMGDHGAGSKDAFHLKKIREIVANEISLGSPSGAQGGGDPTEFSEEAKTSLEILGEIEAPSVKILALDALGTETASAHLLLAATKNVLEALTRDNPTPEIIGFTGLLQGRISLLEGYLSLVQCWPTGTGDNDVTPPVSLRILDLKEPELSLYTDMVARAVAKFGNPSLSLVDLSPAMFLNCFVITGEESNLFAELTESTADSEAQKDLVSSFLFQALAADHCSVSQVIGALSHMRLRAQPIISLLVQFCCRALPLPMLTSLPAIEHIFDAICRLSESATEGCDWWGIYSRCLEECDGVNSALLLALMARAATGKDDEWAQLIGRLADLCALANGKPRLVLPGFDAPITVKSFNLSYTPARALSSIAGATNIPPETITNALAGKAEDQSANDIAALCAYFKDRVHADDVLAHYCLHVLGQWEAAVKSAELGSPALLASALACVRLLSPGERKCFFVDGLWSQHIAKRLATTVALVEKMGKAAKDRLCQKHLGMTRECTEHWLAWAQQVLTLLADTVKAAPANMQKNTKASVWDQPSFPPYTAPGSPIDVTKQQPIIVEHSALASALFLIFKVDARQRPLALFPSGFKARMCPASFFGKESALENVKGGDNGESLVAARMGFVERVVSANQNEAGSKGTAQLMQAAYHFAHSLGVDSDCVRCSHVIWLYRRGLDDKATEQLSLMKNQSLAAEGLLDVVGQRLSVYFLQGPGDISLAATDKQAELFTRLPSEVYDWLVRISKATDGCAPCPIASTQTLLNRAVHLMPQDSPTRAFAQRVSSVVEGLR